MTLETKKCDEGEVVVLVSGVVSGGISGVVRPKRQGRVKIQVNTTDQCKVNTSCQCGNTTSLTIRMREENSPTLKHEEGALHTQ